MGKRQEGNSYDAELGYETGLLRPPSHSVDKRPKGSSWRIAPFVLLGLFLYLISNISDDWTNPPCWKSHHGSRHSHEKVNVILMISDGYGPASETFGRTFHQALHDNASPTAAYQTPLDKILTGSHRSRSTDSFITDSAAGATAFACGVKSYNGAIGVDAEGKPCGTIFEGAKEKGMLTGVVVTSRLTDATPACFVAHVASRAQESEIANQALGLSANGSRIGDSAAPLDLAIGGGGCFFLPKSDPSSCRGDDVDLVSRASEEGWNTHVLFGQQQQRQQEDEEKTANASFFDVISSKLPLLALLAPFNTPYEIDRSSSQPTLAALAMKGIETLDKAPENARGFMIMIEGSQIDLCAHQNDPACHAREIEAYQEAIQQVSGWVHAKNKAGEKTILISTSDHETGGLTLGRQLGPKYPNYAYYPQRLIPVQQSTSMLSAQLLSFARAEPQPEIDAVKDFIRSDILTNGAGFNADNGGTPSEEDVENVFTCLQTTPGISSSTYIRANLADPPIDTADDCRKVLADLISKRAEVGWSTSGHTGVDVPVHVLGSNDLKGNMENIEIGNFIAKTLSIDLKAVTRKVQKRIRRHPASTQA